MKTFKDSTSEEWELSVSVGSVKRVQDRTGVDLMSALDGTLFEQLGQNPILLGDVIYSLCKPQADTRKLTEEQFGERLASGEVIEAAVNAFMEDLISFFRPGQREALTKIATLTKEIQEMQAAEAMETLNNPETLTTAKKLIEKRKAEAKAEVNRELSQLGNSSGIAPESLEQTQAHSRCGS